jgi:hypothetical protein
MSFFGRIFGVAPEGAKSAGQKTEEVKPMTIEQCQRLAFEGHPEGVEIFVGDPSQIAKYFQQDDDGVWLKMSSGGSIIVLKDENGIEYKVSNTGTAVFIQNNGVTVIANQGGGTDEITIGNGNGSSSDIQVSQTNLGNGTQSSVVINSSGVKIKSKME